METTVIYDGEKFRCRYFFDIDEQTEGIEVYYMGNNSLVGTMDGKSFPDLDDQEDVEDFNESVNTWLERQDINYTMG